MSSDIVCLHFKNYSGYWAHDEFVEGEHGSKDMS